MAKALCRPACVRRGRAGAWQPWLAVLDRAGSCALELRRRRVDRRVRCRAGGRGGPAVAQLPLCAAAPGRRTGVRWWQRGGVARVARLARRGGESAAGQASPWQLALAPAQPARPPVGGGSGAVTRALATAHAARRPRSTALATQAIGRAATLALYEELALSPKPGLVTLTDNGSHADMDAHTFMRSLFALRSYFVRIATLGAEGAPFQVLQQCGIDAEARMLAATGGGNTHRGAIFMLGLLFAAAGDRKSTRLNSRH